MLLSITLDLESKDLIMKDLKGLVMWPLKYSCYHEWKEVSRYSNPPANSYKFSAGMLTGIHHDIVYGWTMIEQKCERCGETKSTKIAYAGK